jgi:hypothetical protein
MMIFLIKQLYTLRFFFFLSVSLGFDRLPNDGVSVVLEPNFLILPAYLLIRVATATSSET